MNMHDHSARQSGDKDTRSVSGEQVPENTSALDDFYAIQRAVQKPGRETLTLAVAQQLQRTHGNAFVQRLVNQSRQDGSASSPVKVTASPPWQVARMEKEDDDNDKKKKKKNKTNEDDDTGKDDKQQLINGYAQQLTDDMDLKRACKSGFNPRWDYCLLALHLGVSIPTPKGHMTGGTGNTGTEGHYNRHGSVANNFSHQLEEEAKRKGNNLQIALSNFTSGVKIPNPPTWWVGVNRNTNTSETNNSNQSGDKSLRHNEEQQKKNQEKWENEKKVEKQEGMELHSVYNTTTALSNVGDWKLFQHFVTQFPDANDYTNATLWQEFVQYSAEFDRKQPTAKEFNEWRKKKKQEQALSKVKGNNNNNNKKKENKKKKR